ncbi:hypothetical protein ACOME3_002896 [Neoechinorhynchus agilis]
MKLEQTTPHICLKLNQILRIESLLEGFVDLCVSWQLQGRHKFGSKKHILAIYRESEFEAGKEVYWRYLSLDVSIGQVYCKTDALLLVRQCTIDLIRLRAAIISVEQKILALSGAIKLITLDGNVRRISEPSIKIHSLLIEITELEVHNLPKRLGLLAPDPYVKVRANLMTSGDRPMCYTTLKHSCCNAIWRDQIFLIKMQKGETIDFEVKDMMVSRTKLSRSIGRAWFPMEWLYKHFESSSQSYQNQMTFHLPLKLSQCTPSNITFILVTLNATSLGQLIGSYNQEDSGSEPRGEKISAETDLSDIYLLRHDALVKSYNVENVKSTLRGLRLRYSNCSGNYDMLQR